MGMRPEPRTERNALLLLVTRLPVFGTGASDLIHRRDGMVGRQASGIELAGSFCCFLSLLACFRAVFGESLFPKVRLRVHAS
jgi:hypothetical protein